MLPGVMNELRIGAYGNDPGSLFLKIPVLCSDVCQFRRTYKRIIGRIKKEDFSSLKKIYDAEKNSE